MTTVKPRKQKLIFSQQLMLSFIRDYRNNVCLWDARLPQYKCSDERKLAITRIAQKYDMTEDETRKKINSLRSTYLQEKKKLEESCREGKVTYEPSLYWYKELDFLANVIIPRNAASISSHQTFPKNENVEVDEDHLIVELVHETSGSSSDRGNSYIYQNSPSGRSDDFQSGDDQKRNIVTSSSVSNEDEIDVFCRSIALQLRTLPPQDTIELQMNIQQAVSLKRLEVLQRLKSEP